MYTFLVILIIIASILLILAVLAQSPKSGMAANFGASNQVMGVRQTANFLEKASWYLAIGIVVLSLLATVAMKSSKSESVLSKANAKTQTTTEATQQLPDQSGDIQNALTVEAEAAEATE